LRFFAAICVSFAYAKAAEMTERVFCINNGIDPDELERRFMDKFQTGPSGVCNAKDPGLHKVLLMGLINSKNGCRESARQ
jgi:hypothetical protein